MIPFHLINFLNSLNNNNIYYSFVCKNKVSTIEFRTSQTNQRQPDCKQNNDIHSQGKTSLISLGDNNLQRCGILITISTPNRQNSGTYFSNFSYIMHFQKCII